MHAKKSHKLSVCLCNLASLLTEFGPVKPIKSMKEIESKQVLSAEQLKENIFRASFTSQDLKRSSSNTNNLAIQEE